MLPEDRGAYAIIGPTRQMYEWTYDWLGKALVTRIAPRAINVPTGATVGRAWRDVKNAMRQELPNHATERMSLIGLGDPTAKVVRGPGMPMATPEAGAAPGIHLSVVPNPVRGELTISCAMPAGKEGRLGLYDVGGRLIRETTIIGDTRGDPQRVVWTGRGGGGPPVASGVYFLRLSADRRHEQRRLVVIR